MNALLSDKDEATRNTVADADFFICSKSFYRVSLSFHLMPKICFQICIPFPNLQHHRKKAILDKFTFSHN